MLRRMLFRILAVIAVFSIAIFCFKERVWNVLLAPSEHTFVTYTSIENIIHALGFSSFKFEAFRVDFIATDLSSQFMMHITTTIYLGLLCSSPYIMFELFRFVSPALYENERRKSVRVVLAIYSLFVIGVLMSYYVIFPISFRFLGTYSVAEKVHTAVSLNSYVSTFVCLTFVMGIVFQLPVVAFVLARLGFITADMLIAYRKHAVIVLMLIAAIITPPDLMTLILVSLPLYLLYEISILLCKLAQKKVTVNSPLTSSQ